jgi:WD40 repeat protein
LKKKAISLPSVLLSNNIIVTCCGSLLEFRRKDNLKCIKIKNICSETIITEDLILLSNGNLACKAIIRDSISEYYYIMIFDCNNDYERIKTISLTYSIFSLISLLDIGFASGFSDGSIKIWDMYDDYKLIKTLVGHEGWVLCLEFINNRSILLSGSQDKTIGVWDMKSHVCIISILAHDGKVDCLLSLPNGYFASGSVDGNIKIWDLNNYECINILEGRRYEVDFLVFLEDYRIASLSNFGTVVMWKY